MGDINTVPSQLIETWRTNNRINLRLLDALTEEQLAAVIIPRGKAVIGYFVHIHMARFYWLEHRASALAKSLMKLPGGTAPKNDVRKAMVASGHAMEEFLAESERTGKVKGAKLGPVGFLGYAIAHEGHHRGQILLHLKIAKMPLDKATSYCLWNWSAKGSGE